MSAPRSIGIRLTVYYLLILSLGFGIFAAGTWFAIRISARDAVDGELRDRLQGLGQFMRKQITSTAHEDLRDELREHSGLGPGGDLFQVCDEGGAWVYRSGVLEKSMVPIRKPSELPRDAPVFDDLRVQEKPVRFATARIDIAGHAYAIEVAAPMSALHETLHRLRQTLWLLAPLLLAAAGIGGFWISRRALSPVDAISKTAESISISNLSKRLPVPQTGDELERLSETMNRMLARLQSSIERMTEFTADASHELRAPIAVIRTTAELAARGDRSTNDLREDMAQILAESERTTHLIESLLLLARADSSEDGLQMEPTSLLACARAAVEQARTFASARNVGIDLVGSESLIVVGDAHALQRLFFNLIDNGIKYNRPGGTVKVTLDRLNDHAVCTVSDSGIGIAAPDQPHIFDRFWRADKARSRNSGGTGLGLSIVRWIIERHGSTVEVESEVGQGSRFCVRIPIEHNR